MAERANAPVVYLSTDAAESETGLLQSLVVVNGKAVPFVKRPARTSAEKWDALLYRHGMEGDGQVDCATILTFYDHIRVCWLVDRTSKLLHDIHVISMPSLCL